MLGDKFAAHFHCMS